MYALHLVTWNGRKYLETLFASLKKQTVQPEVVRILENGSRDGTRQWIEEYARGYFPEAEITYLTENIGFAGGHNQLWNDAKEDYVLLVNQDLYLDKRYAEEVLKYLECNQTVATASGVLFQWGTDDVVDSCGIEVLKSGKTQEIRVMPDKDTKVWGVSGTLPMYRVWAIKQVLHPSGSLFDPYFGSYKEDVELAYRLQAVGFESACVKNAHAWHDRSFAAHISRKTRRFENRYTSYRNHLLTLYLHDQWSAVVIAYELGKFCYLAVKEPKVLKGFVDFLRLLPTMKVIRGEYRTRHRTPYG